MNLIKTVLSAVVLGAVALAGPALAQDKPTVGIAMPTKASARWIDDGNNIVKVLKERGYNTDLQYAEDDIPNQLSQIENMVTKGAKVLVIASIDGTTLSDVLKQAKHRGMDKVSTLRWDGATAQARMDNLLSAFYTTKRVDAVLSPYDGLSIGILSSLKGVGYGSGNMKMPIVSGQDAEVPSIKSMLRGEQYSTIFKDTRDLAKVTVDMVDAALSGKTVPVNDTKTYNNGVKVVPSYLLKPVVVDKSNWEKTLVEGGYYKRSQIQ